MISIQSYLLSFKHIISNKIKNIKLVVNSRLCTTKMTPSKILRPLMNPRVPTPSSTTGAL
jgi:hypothetical protein